MHEAVVAVEGSVRTQADLVRKGDGLGEGVDIVRCDCDVRLRRPRRSHTRVEVVLADEVHQTVDPVRALARVAKDRRT